MLAPPSLRDRLLSWRCFALLAAFCVCTQAGADSHRMCLPLANGAVMATKIASDCVGDGESADGDIEVARCLVASGRSAEAILHLQRLVVNRPDDCAALELLRLALARANAGPMAHTASFPGNDSWPSSLERILEATRHATRIGIAAGHDSNINSATAIDVVGIPVLNHRSLVLNPLLVRRASSFTEFNGEADLKVPLSDSVEIGARAAAMARYNNSLYVYFPHSYFAALAVEKRFGSFSLDLAANYMQRRLAGYRIVERVSQEVTASGTPAPGLRLFVSLASARIKYPYFADLVTGDQSTSLRLTHTASGLEVAYRTARERSNSTIKDLDRDYSILALHWNKTLGSAGRIYLHVAETRSDYREFSALFLAQRFDRTRVLALAYEYRVGAGWALTPKLAVEHNASSIPIIAFRRNQWLLELSKEF